MSIFQCGTNCHCSEDECNGNPNSNSEFGKLKLFDQNIIDTLITQLTSLKKWNIDNLKNCVGKIDKIKGATINIALTGRASNPIGCVETLEILGKELSLQRLKDPKSLIFF